MNSDAQLSAAVSTMSHHSLGATADQALSPNKGRASFFFAYLPTPLPVNGEDLENIQGTSASEGTILSP